MNSVCIVIHPPAGSESVFRLFEISKLQVKRKDVSFREPIEASVIYYPILSVFSFNANGIIQYMSHNLFF